MRTTAEYLVPTWRAPPLTLAFWRVIGRLPGDGASQSARFHHELERNEPTHHKAEACGLQRARTVWLVWSRWGRGNWIAIKNICIKFKTNAMKWQQLCSVHEIDDGSKLICHLHVRIPTSSTWGSSSSMP